MYGLSGDQGVIVRVYYLLYFGALVIAGHIVMAGDQTPMD
jgi:hypothetical protein